MADSKMKVVSLLFVSLFLFAPVTLSAQLSSTYQFNVTLVQDSYWLYWNFNTTTQTISFAVRVRTTGWIGFGLSPNGQMPGSDVVIGWIGISRNYFHDRYAEGRYTPLIDPIQNWFLTNAEVDNGYTTLEFYRNFITCDDRDLDIQPEAMQVVYSWNDVKPTITFSGTGQEIFSINRHTVQGSATVNLVSQFPRPPQSSSEQRLFVGNDQTNIPTGDTYWCRALRLPDSIQSTPRYITQYFAAITEGNKQYISDMFVYSCDGLENEDLGSSGMSCNDGRDSSTRIGRCLNGRVIAVWGRGDKGGEAFVYPDHVAHKLGGIDNPDFIAIRIHYNIPTNITMIQDSSGIQFNYTFTPRQYNGGILAIGHSTHPNMVIPPNSHSYTLTGMCSGSCTKNNLPTSGINVFANLFHTGSHATSLEVTHIQNTTCSGTFLNEQLRPLDRNLFYNKTLQASSFFPREMIIDQGDSLLLKCSYNTAQENRVILGGTSPGEESCLSFLVYYPYTEMTTCTSYPQFNNFNEFINSQVPTAAQTAFNSLNLDPQSSSSSSSSAIANVMNTLEWNQTQISAYQRLIYEEGRQSSTCNQMIYDVSVPSTGCCSYVADDVCTRDVIEGTPCCERQCVLDTVGSGGCGISSSLCLVFLFIAFFLLIFHF